MQAEREREWKATEEEEAAAAEELGGRRARRKKKGKMGREFEEERTSTDSDDQHSVHLGSDNGDFILWEFLNEPTF